jgi:hypothetical protein
MFFLIRCTFWLTIVFHAMPWPQQAPSAEGAGGLQDQMFKAAAGVAGDLAASAGTMLKAKLEEGCVKAPADCLASAARLPQIVATGQAQLGQALEVVPPKRPVRLAEAEASRLTSVHKAPVQHN